MKQIFYRGMSNGIVLSALRARAAPAHTAVLMYHELAEDHADVEAWTVVRKSDFLRQMEYLQRYYDVVSLDQAIERMRVPGDAARPLAVVTFDDGDRGNATVLLPILDALKIPVTVYVSTQHVLESNPYWFDRIVNALQTRAVVTLDLRAHALGRYTINATRGPENWCAIGRLLEDLKRLEVNARAAAVESALAELRASERRPNCRIEPLTLAEMKALAACPDVTIGAHSHCHNILTQIAPTEAERSVALSKTLLEQWTARRIEHFAYPNGNYDDRVTAIVRNAGFRSAVTTEPRLWGRHDTLFTIPRVGIGRYDSPAQFKLNLVGGVRQFLPRGLRRLAANRMPAGASTPLSGYAETARHA